MLLRFQGAWVRWWSFIRGRIKSIPYKNPIRTRFPLSQLRWSVIQKEAYGIFHSCMYLQSLLLDRLFKIRTDHRNLLFIKEASNLMIVRWYMALSEFSFTLEFIPGVENDIADAMSRLGRNNMVDSLTPHKNILKNTFSQQFLHQPNQTKPNETKVRSQRLAWRTTQKLATLQNWPLSTAECLLQHFGRFGAPRQLRSDNGPHFIADVIKDLWHFCHTCIQICDLHIH